MGDAADDLNNGTVYRVRDDFHAQERRFALSTAIGADLDALLPIGIERGARSDAELRTFIQTAGKEKGPA
jgi:hypothetical protein